MARHDRGQRMDRRTFLEGLVAGVASVPLASFGAAQSGKSRVAVAERAGIIAKGRIDRKVVKEAVDALVKKLSGKSNVDKAWRTFVSPKETVALKFNGLFRGGTTSPQVVWAVCRGLADAGVLQEKMIVLDRNRKDFDTAGLAAFEDLPKIRFLPADSQWDTEVKAGPVTTRITRILTEDADAIINLPRLKNHPIAGVTISMKNHLGSVPNGREYHGKIDSIAELNLLPPIRKKTRLAVCDAIVGIFDKGPSFSGPHVTWEARSLLAATDVVALDAVGAEMIRKARLAKGAGPTRPRPTHIAHAAQMGLGTADLERIEIVKA